MKKSQLLVLVVAAAAVALIALVTSGKGNSAHGHATPAGPSAAHAPRGAVIVSVASSPEKLALVQQLARSYDATRPTVGGRPVVVTVKTANSGDEATAIARAARGGIGDRPVVWSPASSLWLRLLGHETHRGLVADTNPSIVRTPLVLAVWEPMARALGWPRRKLGFADILRLVRQRRGWAAYGHPEYGDFKLVHTNPSVSTSGLEAVAAEYFAAAGKREGLTVADVRRPGVRAQIADIEASIVHYGDTTLYIADQLRENGPGYASIVAMEETTLIAFNRHRGSQPRLVAVYPREGTFFSDSPYAIVRAPWVSAAQRRAAAAFGRYIAGHVTARFAARYGFRPPDPEAAPAPPVDATHGADPRQPTRILEAPDPDVLAAIQRSWQANRKPANIELVVDTSGSMSDSDKLEHAKEGLATFIRALSPRDRVGLITFNDKVEQALPVKRVSRSRAVLSAEVGHLFSGGGTAAYDATDRALSDVEALNDPSRINAIVLLTDGEDLNSEVSLDALLRRLRTRSESEQGPIRVFTIAYGADADHAVLDRIAEAADGRPFQGDTGSIEGVYRSISSFF
jgi:Ca-activated chloride channel family protein